MDARTKKVWISIAVAFVLIVVILGASLIGGAVLFFRSHINSQYVSAETASDEFSRTRARFAGQEPLIELRGEFQQEAVVHKREAPEHAELQTLRVLAFDTRQQKIVHVSIPFWILRLARDKPFHLNGGVADFDSDQLHLTVDDLERAGPGLILDTRRRRNGGEVIVWTE